MSKILVKAQQQNVFNLNGSGTTGMAYVLRPVRYTTMNAEDIINYCSANSIVPKAYLSASMIAIAQCIENFLLNGHSVEFPNLGIFSLTSSGISEADINKVGMEQFHKLNVRFLPSSQLKAEVEAVTLEFDGIYDIAGEEVVGNRADGSTKSYKYYKKVRRGQAGLSTGFSTGPSTGSGALNGQLEENRSEDDE
jgi:nucleoid DNA-binding protein